MVALPRRTIRAMDMQITPILTLQQFLDLPGPHVVLDARSAAARAKAPYPGSLAADLEEDLSTAATPGFDPARGGRHPLPGLATWCSRLGDWGITPETAVAVFDDTFGAMGAARAWWMLRAVSHRRVCVLDGGWQALQGAPLPALPGIPPATAPYPAQTWQNPTVDLATVDQLRTHPDWKVLDVRAQARFEGQSEAIDPVAGHIPGAFNLPLTENLVEGGRYRSPEALRQQYQAFLEDTPVDHLVVSCGSGVSACHTLLALAHAGLEGASLYIGSWSEWCRSDKPQATGPGGR